MAILSASSLLKNTQVDTRIELTDDLMVRLHQVLLEIVKDFARICENHNFYYSLSGGSALGAVRHHGFIPWDDDVDVFMLRKDFNEFVKIFHAELGDKYILHSMETTPELGFPVAQMMKRGTVFKVNGTLGCEECGIYIDIFILENAPDNLIIRCIHGIVSLYYGLCLSCARFYNKRDYYLEMYKNADSDVMKVILRKIRIGRLLSWRSLAKWAQKYTKWNALCRNENSKYVVCPTGVKHYFKEIFPREKYCVTQKMRFEDTELSVIKEFDWALSRLYGNYMELPPEEKRETHFVLEIDFE